jgi:hypothetical protein
MTGTSPFVRVSRMFQMRIGMKLALGTGNAHENLRISNSTLPLCDSLARSAPLVAKIQPVSREAFRQCTCASSGDSRARS